LLLVVTGSAGIGLTRTTRRVVSGPSMRVKSGGQAAGPRGTGAVNAGKQHGGGREQGEDALGQQVHKAEANKLAASSEATTLYVARRTRQWTFP
jgi:hypothetical protein